MYKLFPEMAIETEAFYDKFSLQWQSTRKRKENPLTTLDSSYRKIRAWFYLYFLSAKFIL